MGVDKYGSTTRQKKIEKKKSGCARETVDVIERACEYRQKKILPYLSCLN
jgi:hypothetical protein